jgi:hypothetical protein
MTSGIAGRAWLALKGVLNVERDAGGEMQATWVHTGSEVNAMIQSLLPMALL